MGVLKGDFIGFSYNGVHSSDLGIIRTSEGSRFNESLLPTMHDKTVQVPGGDGTYYFGSYYTQRELSISFAFESVTEQQLSFIRELFGDKKIHPLVFDEKPYKTYYAKVTGSTMIKHIPFSQGENNRIYKGEGTLQFTCYQPYAVCSRKFLEEYEETNRNEWSEASGLLESGEGIDVLSGNNITVYNPGVKAADFRIFFKPGEDKVIGSGQLVLGSNILKFSGCTLKEEDEYLVFNSKTKMIEGICAKETDSDGKIIGYTKSKNIYNEYISDGNFFDIPVTVTKTFDTIQQTTQNLSISTNLANYFDSIDYNYYYF